MNVGVQVDAPMDTSITIIFQLEASSNIGEEIKLPLN